MVRTVKKPEGRRGEIVATARELFQKKDYESTTMQDIMNALEIAKGTIYHYFKSKEELLEAVVEDTVEEYIAGMEKVLNETEGNGLEKMQALITSGNVEEQYEEILEHLHRPGNVSMHTRQLAVTLSRLAPLYASAIQQGRVVVDAVISRGRFQFLRQEQPKTPVATPNIQHGQRRFEVGQQDIPTRPGFSA